MPKVLLTRRAFFAGILGSVGAVIAGSSYARLVEPEWLDVTTKTLRLPRAAPGAGVRVLHLSDFHASDVVPMTLIREAVKLGLAARPDLVLLTGDFFTTIYENRASFAAALAPLAAAAPTFACAGNHDGGAWSRRAGGYDDLFRLREMLESARITLLHNTSAELTLRGRRVQLVGAGDYWTGDCRPDLAFRHLAPRAGALRLVLNHNPDAKDLFLAHDWDLMLCGHTHGGQCCLPLLGAPFAPVRDKNYVAGLLPWAGDRWIHITRGVGNLHGVRFNCRPEVSLLEIA
jgi:predicted MPP superfamily phosphohydrolase